MMGGDFVRWRTEAQIAGRETLDNTCSIDSEPMDHLAFFKKQQMSWTRHSTQDNSLTRIVERSLAWLERNRRLSQDYELKSKRRSAQSISPTTFDSGTMC
jgi:hypothetical protein